jgi:exonuclease III
MRFLFWNINSSISDRKIGWLEKIIDKISPNVLCLAEGPESICDCNNLLKFIEDKGYRTYYSPTFYNNTIISSQYGWNKFGLKVLIKNDISIKSKFVFGNQKLEGRIIYLRFEINNINYSTFLLHGMSKSGDDIDQNDFISELSKFIMAKTIGKEQDKIILLGDFNIEPWEELLKKKKYIYSLFYNKSFKYFFEKPIQRIYTSPIFDYIQNHPNECLLGTFYNKNYISILDFPLLSKDLSNYKIDILTEINEEPLIIDKNGRHLLTDGFDHLPISLQIL